jgi:hypothetical protein
VPNNVPAKNVTIINVKASTTTFPDCTSNMEESENPIFLDANINKMKQVS